MWTKLRCNFARVAVPTILVSALLVTGTGPASGAKPGGGGSSTATGNDVSYPQCGTTLPSALAFGIVGVNDGLANTLNPCFGPSTTYPNYAQSELYWAVASSKGGTSQPKASLYVNTADPGNMYNGAPINDWPTTSLTSDPYACSTTTVTTSTGATVKVGENSLGCAWQYGYSRAAQDMAWLASAASAVNTLEATINVSGSPLAYPWWLDVETANTWQSGTFGQAMNVADLQGMVHALQSSSTGVSVGVYSTSSQWDQITGGITPASGGSLWGLQDWIPGARTLKGARSNCGLTSYTGGKVSVTQWFSNPDGDYACP
jgi:hypothetical protein